MFDRVDLIGKRFGSFEQEALIAHSAFDITDQCPAEKGFESVIVLIAEISSLTALALRMRPGGTSISTVEYIEPSDRGIQIQARRIGLKPEQYATLVKSNANQFGIRPIIR